MKMNYRKWGVGMRKYRLSKLILLYIYDALGGYMLWVLVLLSSHWHLCLSFKISHSQEPPPVSHLALETNVTVKDVAHCSSFPGMFVALVTLNWILTHKGRQRSVVWLAYRYHSHVISVVLRFQDVERQISLLHLWSTLDSWKPDCEV